MPDSVIICHVKEGDVDLGVLDDLPFETLILRSSPGLTAQRNRILNELKKCDAVVFFDDDFFPASDYLKQVDELLLQNDSAVILTGRVLADGAKGAGILPEMADKILSASDREHPRRGAPRNIFSAYGCNMAIRLAPVFKNGLKFDEYLPLYGWLEDMAFTRQIVRYGEALWVPQLRGVHLAIKAARTSGLSFGYAQIANPVHLWRGGLIPWRVVLSHAGKNFVSNALRLFGSDANVDRKGRLVGNLIAMRDLFLGQLDPNRILNLKR
ncbi:glycosyltransferase [Bradyrhizobium ottawaense]|nr:glycosyltransferase [Bradyrhizobium ottawaense]BBO07709.1 glycosyl transferase [Bradyrhizobium ottawaense]GMO41878.1 glycosyltransferase [Bradyrhizobium ottawaense]GMO46900.1 glycosyltransferase [Bradyrhizobium ottawaense]GMO52264.1 glycosyltransferase [Bradyrhizobium ottawaense]